MNEYKKSFVFQKVQFSQAVEASSSLQSETLWAPVLTYQWNGNLFLHSHLQPGPGGRNSNINGLWGSSEYRCCFFVGKELLKVVQAPNQDASWVLSFGVFSCTSS